MPFIEWSGRVQQIGGSESHWFDYELGDQNGTATIIAPYTADFGNGVPPWTATLTTTEIGANGQVVSGPAPIATYQTGFDFQTTDALLTGGERGIYWTVANGTYPASNAVDIDFRPVDSTNTPAGPPVTLLSDVANLYQFRVGTLATGGSASLVAYATYNAVSQTEQVSYAGFNANGTPIAGETGTIETFSSPGYDAFGFGTLAPSTAKSPSFIYLRAIANNGSPGLAYETIGTTGTPTSSLTAIPLTYGSGSTDRQLATWDWGRLSSTTGNNLAVAAITTDSPTGGGTERNLEVRFLNTKGGVAADDIVPLATSNNDLSMSETADGGLVLSYVDGGVAYLRAYNNTGDLTNSGTYFLPAGAADVKIESLSSTSTLLAFTSANATVLDYDLFQVTAGSIEYRADAGITRTGLKLQSNDSLLVKTGGRAFNTVVNGGAVNVLAGGATHGTTLNGGTEQLFAGATATETIVDSSGDQLIVTGATATGTVINAGGQQNVGGVTRNTVVDEGAYQFVGQPGRDYNALLNAGGSQWLSGFAEGTQIDGGDQLVQQGASVRAAVVNAGDQDVSAGGSASGTVVNGGGQYVEGGGVATLTTVNGGGLIDVMAGGTVRGLVLNGGQAELQGDGILIAASGAVGLTDNGGLLVKETGTGTSLIKANVVQTAGAAGRVEAASGSLEFGGTLSGALDVTADAGAALIFDKAVGVGTILQFSGGSVGAQLNAASDFHGSIAGFGAGDTLDLRSILDSSSHAPTLGYSASSGGGTLTLSDGTHSASLALSGAYAQTGFHVAADGHGGSLVTYG